MIIANVAEDEIENEGYKNNPAYQKLVEKFGKEKVVPICAKVASELSQLSDEESARNDGTHRP